MAIVDDRSFIKSVENFIFKNDQKYAEEIAAKKSQIPVMFKTKMELYRGMILDKDLVEAIQNGYSGFTLKNITSWTSNIKMAERFINDPSKRLKYNVEDNKIGVIFKKKFVETQIILNIQNFVMFMDFSNKLKEFNFDVSTKEMAFEEAEVLVDKNIKLSRANIMKIIKV